jgi:anti-anti-sigma factor
MTLRVSTQVRKGVGIITCTGSLGVTNAGRLRKDGLQLLEDHRPRQLVILLDQVKLTDPSALAVLIGLTHCGLDTGTQICAVTNPAGTQLLQHAGLNRYLDTHPTLQEALDHTSPDQTPSHAETDSR